MSFPNAFIENHNCKTNSKMDSRQEHAGMTAFESIVFQNLLFNILLIGCGSIIGIKIILNYNSTNDFQ